MLFYIKITRQMKISQSEEKKKNKFYFPPPNSHDKSPHSFRNALMHTKQSGFFNTTAKQITYNSFITDGPSNSRGRYELKNYRQPKLKITEEPAEKKQKINSYIDLKELMKQKIQKQSLKNQFDKYCALITDQQILEKLKTELNMLPLKLKTTNKGINMQERKSHEPERKVLNLTGSRFYKQGISHPRTTKNSYKSNVGVGKAKILQTQKEQKQQLYWEQKYKKIYRNKAYEKTSKAYQKVNKMESITREDIFTPLTGWN